MPLRRATTLLLLLPWGCGSPAPAPPALGEPLAGLAPAELAAFRAGQALFNHVFTAEAGVGPLFNENQCSGCHTDPVSGGTGEQLVLKATRFTPPADCDLLRSEGGENVRRQATPLLRAHGIEREAIPERATERGRFAVPFLFGLGLVEAIPDAVVLARADPLDADGDGVSGRAARTPEGRVGRFGRKGDVATLRDFVDSALRFEMGLTTPADPRERGPAGAPLPPGSDPAADPEVDERTVELLTQYVRLLAPPARRVAEDPERRADAERGERLFHSIGCTACHTPALPTGDSEVEALRERTVALYSDLLLHDLGPRLASVCGHSATPTEYRTAPLMGVGWRRAFLHDGRATNLHEAILLHGGEATRARAAFAALGRVEQERIVRFLQGL